MKKILVALMCLLSLCSCGDEIERDALSATVWVNEELPGEELAFAIDHKCKIIHKYEVGKDRLYIYETTYRLKGNIVHINDSWYHGDGTVSGDKIIFNDRIFRKN